MVTPNNVVSIFSNTAQVIEALDRTIRKSRGRKRKLLIELLTNIEMIDLYTEGEAPIIEVIKRLESRSFEEAIESNFNFKSFKAGKIKENLIETPQHKSYLGWSTERLFTHIYVKIKTLKTLVDIDPQNEKYRKSVRLINLRKLMILLLKHVSS